jgi:hypothetical protein
MAWGPDAPVYWHGIPEPERRRRVELTPDLCVIDGEHWFELEPTEHPLAVEQRTGITMERVREIAERLVHPQG